MINKLKSALRGFRIWILLVLSALGLISFRSVDDNYFELSRNLDIFTTVLRELSVYYVDPADPKQLVEEGIHSMLESLDPYTQFIPEEEAEDYRFMTTGQYGGIGALIGQRGDDVIITDPYAGFPAQKGGLQAGDIIRAIDGKAIKGKKYDEVSRMLKGQPNTPISITVERSGESQPLVRSLVREEITIPNVPYYGMIDQQQGYIRLGSFTDDAAKEVKAAMEDLVQKKGAKGVILDLRGNPGGLLNEAVDIVNVFIDKGQEVVSTRGKIKEWDKIYRSQHPATDNKTPIVVLVNSGSASASEIVSGALQDLDRAVIVGQRTFGKGLVQTTRPLTYNAQLKITTAKYYIPSGRCIQALDYTHRNPDGSVGKVPDSLISSFKTKNGRVVYDGGGITPDYALEPQLLSSISQALINNYILFDFATQYKITHPTIASAKDFQLSDAEYEDFIKWQADKKYDYITDSEKKLEELREKAEKEKYFEHIKAEYEAVKKLLVHDKATDLRINKEEVREMLENEIVSRYYYQNGRLETSFDTDPDVQAALKALRDPSVYQQMMNRQYKP
ncbi:MAG: S41 family peptidase [Bacteroidia bacterium]|jgi:carboxyl-terminal processing protease|nr:S41 family peptidase [Bacteroidia bacterium]